MKPKKTSEEMNGVAEVELIYHNKVKAADRPKIVSPAEAYKVLIDGWNKDAIELVEEFKVMLLNTCGSLLGVYALSKGGITGTTVDPRLVYVSALKAAASSIILAHNHPSGEIRPSEADEKLTRKIKTGAELLDIKVNDHLIVTPDTYFSFADQGLL